MLLLKVFVLGLFLAAGLAVSYSFSISEVGVVGNPTSFIESAIAEVK